MSLTGNSLPNVTRDSRVSRAPPNHTLPAFANHHGSTSKPLQNFSKAIFKFNCLLKNYHQKIIFIFSRVRLRIDNEKKVNAMKWYSYLILLLMYIIYLAIGAYVFQMFEKPHEVRNCANFIFL